MIYRSCPLLTTDTRLIFTRLFGYSFFVFGQFFENIFKTLWPNPFSPLIVWKIFGSQFIASKVAGSQSHSSVKAWHDGNPRKINSTSIIIIKVNIEISFFEGMLSSKSFHCLLVVNLTIFDVSIINTNFSKKP